MLSIAMAAQRVVIDKVKSKMWSDVKAIQQLIHDLPTAKYQRSVRMINYVAHRMYGYRCTKILEALSVSKGSCLLEYAQSECNNVCTVSMVIGI